MQLCLNYDPHIIKTEQPWVLSLFTCGSKLGPWHAISECCFRSVVFSLSQTSMSKLNASKIKSPHESSTKTKWAQMAFKESHLAYETLGTWKTSELFYFVMPFFGWKGFSEIRKKKLRFGIFRLQVLTWIHQQVAAKFQQCIGWFLTQKPVL